MAVIRIDHLRVRAIIGTHPWERANKQEISLHLTISYDASKASKSDALKDALDYEALTKRVVALVERSRYLLLEKLTAKVLDALMADKRVEEAFVRIDKPQALPEAKCVSFELSAIRKKA